MLQVLATYRVAEHILSLNVDSLMDMGEPDIVHQIARVQIKEKVRYNYSFATKYCAWHNPDAYPIYDSFVEQILWGYKKQDGFYVYRRQDLWNSYQVFKNAIQSFRQYYDLLAFSLKEIDKFLWIAGKEYYPRTWNKERTENIGSIYAEFAEEDRVMAETGMEDYLGEL